MLRRFLIWLIGFTLLVPPSILLLVLLGLQTEAGRGLLVSLVERLSADAGVPVSIARIKGRVPFDTTLEGVSVSDPKGIWFEAESLRVVWDPATVLNGRARLEALTVAGGALHRAPALPEDPQTPPPSEPLALPPVPLIVDRLLIDGFVVGPELAGDAVTVDGRFQASTSGTRALLDGSMIAAAEAGEIGSADLNAAYDLATDTLSVEVVAAADRNAALVKQALPVELPGDISVRLTGEGPVDGWTGQLEASGGEGVGLTADLSLTRPAGNAVRFQLDGAGEIGGLAAGVGLEGMDEPLPVRVTVSRAANGEISLETARLTGLGSQLSAEGVFMPDTGAASLDGTVEIWDGHRLPSIEGLPSLQGGSASFSAAIDGRSLRADLTAKLMEVVLERADGTSRVETIAVDGSLDGPLAALTGSGDTEASFEATARLVGLEALDRGPEPLLEASRLIDRVEASLSGSLSRQRRLVSLDRAFVDVGEATLEGSGTVRDFQWLEISGTASAPDLSVFAESAGRPLSGGATVRADATVGISPIDIGGLLDVELSELKTGDPDLDPLLGEKITLETAFAVDEAGALSLDSLFVAAERVRAQGRLALTAAGALSGRLTATVPNLAPFSPLAGRTVAGRAEAEVELGGSLDAPAVRADWKAPGLAVDEAPSLSAVGGRVDLVLDAAQSGVAGAIRASARLNEAPISLAAALRVADAGDRIEIDDLVLEAPASRIAGSLTVQASPTLVDGSLVADVTDLDAVTAMLGEAAPAVSGALSATVSLSSVDGQAADIGLIAQAVSTGGVSVETVDVTARIVDVFGARSGRLDGTVTGLAAGAARLDSTALAVLIEGEAISAGLRSSGVVVAPEGETLQLSASAGAWGTLSDGTADISLDQLDAVLADRRLQLAAPARLGVGGGELSMEGLRLEIGDGRIEIEGSVGEEALSGAVKAVDLPLDLARMIAPTLALDGRVDAAMTVGGSPSDPAVVFKATASEISPVPPLPGAPTGRLVIDGGVQDHAVSATVTGTANAVGSLTASLRTRLTPQEYGLPVLLPDAGISGEATGKIDLALIPAILDLGEDRVVGSLDVDLAFAGTVDAPTATGAVSLSDGRVENDALGTIADEIALRLVGDGNRLRLETFSATDGEAGVLTGRGGVRLDPVAAFPFQFEVEAEGFTAVRRDEATVKVAMDTTLEGDTRGATLAGTVTVEEAEIFIAAPPPADVVLVEIEEVGQPQNRPLDRPKEPPKPSPILLDMTVDIPGRAFVRGRGVDSEWRGNLDIAGDANQPLVKGSIEVVRGTFKAVGRTFTFAEGLVGLNGDPEIDPSVAIRLTTELSDLEVDIKVSGTAKAPVIDVVSSPPLPEDEILARILFGQSVAELSPLQALQLARSAAILSGELDGPGALDGVRDQLGFDTIDLTGGGEGGLEAVGLSVGKYIAPGVFLQLVQGLSTASSKAVVEVELTDSVTVESDLGADSQGRVGVNLKLDY